jgi:hypothetical protein
MASLVIETAASKLLVKSALSKIHDAQPAIKNSRFKLCVSKLAT